MKILISPAKKMIEEDGIECRELPRFIEKTERLKNLLCGMSYYDLKGLWKCSDKITQQNLDRLKKMNLRERLTPAIFSYEGIQYRYMSPGVFTDEELEYIQKNLIILSGFYGMLRPLDGVTPYRLEMQAKLSADDFSSLYEFWGKELGKQLSKESDVIINLASKEYSKAVSDNLTEGVCFITCTFAEKIDGKLIEKGTQCKMARGEMVRFMAENKIENEELIKGFNCQNYEFSHEHSTKTNYVFIKGGNKNA